eukprot:236664-Chlamydomonas_euryale.AAC.2
MGGAQGWGIGSTALGHRHGGCTGLGHKIHCMRTPTWGVHNVGQWIERMAAGPRYIYALQATCRAGGLPPTGLLASMCYDICPKLSSYYAWRRAC